MRTDPPHTTSPAERFRFRAFTLVPLTVLVGTAALAVMFPEPSIRAAPLPWILSLVLIGLPHGAADLAVSRSACRGSVLWLIGTAYVALMGLVAVTFLIQPRSAIVAFVVASCWHFGSAHRAEKAMGRGAVPRVIAVAARGCAVLAAPLACWPVESSRAATELVSLTLHPVAESGLFASKTVRLTGVGLAVIALLSTLAEGVITTRTSEGLRRWWHLIGELLAIAVLGWATDPLLSVGTYFLAWHAWRQMDPLSMALGGIRSESWNDVGRGLVRIHAAALPLLLPTWAAIGFVWWTCFTGHTLRDLALVSIGAYLIVTPAHELLEQLVPVIRGRHLASPASSRDGIGGVHLRRTARSAFLG